MDRSYIDQHENVNRYLRGELSDDEADLFEEHLLLSPDLQAEVEAEERFAEGLRSLAESGELGATATRARPSNRALGLAWAASLLIALLPAYFFLRQSQTLERELAVQRQAGSGVETGAPAAEVEALREELRQVTRPRAETPVLRLAPTRSAVDGGEPSHRLSLGDTPEWVVLLLEPPEPLAASYRLELEGPDGTILWQHSGVAPDAQGALAVIVYSTELVAGIHLSRATPEDGSPPFEVGLRILRP